MILCDWAESNRRPPTFQKGALPTELQSHAASASTIRHPAATLGSSGPSLIITGATS